MRGLLFALPAALALAACVEVDMTVEVLGEDEARLTGFMQMQRQMYDMSGGDDSFCAEEDGGTLVLSDTHARCEFDKTGTFAELMRPDAADDVPTEIQGELTYLDSNRVRALFPLSAMNDGMDEMIEDPQMMAMMRQMFDGMSISFSVQGREIESTTGTISDDGTRATILLGVDDLISDEGDQLDDFETIVRF
ncbi:MAG: hypothetical protein EA338_06400 [Roseinatronobacter sp.]|uniref:Lipoprotein n=1 Tax=Roseinatronobacter monicus TaxID=393481 RepID=A0A543KBY7_9RHOB|nr:hypothetical protein [Roseinatronobacter monicus]TQM92590.1 hypothetical protein BD293_1201 [Roseinatronobacter monicus]TVP99712.1 MAG: hypothetical protein EA338_06400 [Roseinatronobacter sp.]